MQREDFGDEVGTSEFVFLSALFGAVGGTTYDDR